MESPTTYHALATHLHTLLETEPYSKTTMKDREFILDSFTAYIIENNLDEYMAALKAAVGNNEHFYQNGIQICFSPIALLAVGRRKNDKNTLRKADVSFILSAIPLIFFLYLPDLNVF